MESEVKVSERKKRFMKLVIATGRAEDEYLIEVVRQYGQRMTPLQKVAVIQVLVGRDNLLSGLPYPEAKRQLRKKLGI